MTLGSLIPFNEGFLNFKFFNLPKIFETLLFDFSSVVSSTFAATSLLILILFSTTLSSFEEQFFAHQF